MTHNDVDKHREIHIDIQDDETTPQDPESAISSDEQKNEPAEPVKAEPDYRDQLQRVQADFVNYRRRQEQRMQEWKTMTAREIVRELLPVIDDFDILFQHHADDERKVNIDGVQLIYNKMMAILSELGLESIDTDNHQFDPHVHDAVMVEETDKVKEGNILRVWQKGFKFKGNLLRPAKVITAKSNQAGDDHGTN